MALELLSTPLADTRPKKRPRLGWDVGPFLFDDSSYLQLQLTTQISLAQNSQSFQYAAASDPSLGANQTLWMHNRGTDPTAWREDDKDGHLQFEIGDVLSSRYKVVRKIGEGTFGRVLECQDLQTHEFVAVKVIRSAEKYREAAMIEVDVLRMLHFNDKNGTRGCVEIKNWFDFRNHICIVFEKLGPSLYEFLRANNYRSYLVDHVREFGRQLLESVAYMHSLRLIHTDLKPENILLVSSEYVKVTDHKGEALFQTHENLEHLAMMEQVLGPIPSSIIRRAKRRSEKYFKHGGRELYWPEGASSRESIKAVRRLPRLQNLIMEHADHSAGLLIDLLEKLLRYDAKERLTAKEALEHPFFRISARR